MTVKIAAAKVERIQEGFYFSEHLQLMRMSACREPEALPFCALAYALIGVISTVLVSIPAVRGSLVAITA